MSAWILGGFGGLGYGEFGHGWVFRGNDCPYINRSDTPRPPTDGWESLHHRAVRPFPRLCHGQLDAAEEVYGEVGKVNHIILDEEVPTKPTQEEVVAMKEALDEMERYTVASRRQVAAGVQSALDEAVPALEQAIMCLDQLAKRDVDELRWFARPPPRCMLTMEALCIMFGVRHYNDWGEAKRLLYTLAMNRFQTLKVR